MTRPARPLTFESREKEEENRTADRNINEWIYNGEINKIEEEEEEGEEEDDDDE